jgi:hypothetical protein
MKLSNKTNFNKLAKLKNLTLNEVEYLKKYVEEKTGKKIERKESKPVKVKVKKVYNRKSKVNTKPIYKSINTGYNSLSIDYNKSLEEPFEPNELIDVEEVEEDYRKFKRLVIGVVLGLIAIISLIIIL